MKARTSAFKETVKKFGRELDSLITYDDNGVTTELGMEELNSVSPHYEGAILKSVMKQLDIDSNVDIPIGTVINYKFGVKVRDANVVDYRDNYDYVDYGNYVVYASEKQEDTSSYKIVCYDKMLYSMVDYTTPLVSGTPITYPITVRDYLSAICTHLGLTFANSSDKFANYDEEIASELYLDNEGKSLDYRFRDVLDELAQVTASTICINADDELEVRYIKDVGEIINVSASNIEITNGEAYELQKFELEGKTTQLVTTGANLQKYTVRSYNHYSNYYNCDSSGQVSITGTGTGNINNLSYNQTSSEPMTLEAGNYTLKVIGNLETTKIKVMGSEVALDSNQEYRFTLSQTTSNFYIGFLISAGTHNENFYVTLASGNTATTERYTNGLPTPTPDYPSELKSVGIQNVINVDFEKGTLSGQTGTPSSANNRLRTNDYIEVNPNTNYNLYVSSEFVMKTYVFEYKADGTFIKRIPSSWGSIPFSFITSANTYKVKIVFTKSAETAIDITDISDVMLIKESTTNSYIPYGKYGIEVSERGKNLAYISSLTVSSYTAVLNDDTIDINGGASSAGAIIINLNDKGITLKANKTYTMSFKTTGSFSGTGYKVVYLRFDNSNKNCGNLYDNFTYTFTPDYDTLLDRIMLDLSANYVFDNYTIQILLEENNQATEYEPYQNNKQLYLLDEPLRSIGDVKDKLYIQNGTLFVERKIGSVVLDGSEEWNKSTNTSVDRFIQQTTRPQMNVFDAISNYFINSTGTNAGTFYFDSSSNGSIRGRIIVNFSAYGTTTLEQFLTWLSTHNTTVYYVLATPTIEELGETTMLSTYEGITHIETTDALEPTMNIGYMSEFEQIDEEYLKDINVNFGEKFGAVNTIVLTRSAGSDSITEPYPVPENPIEIKIEDNQILNFNDRDNFKEDIYDKLNGLEYYLNDFSSTGVCYLDLCDRYKVKIGETVYTCIMFNDEVNITQGLEENIYTPMPEETNTDYSKADKTDRKINQAYLIVDKQNGTISGVVKRLSDDEAIIDETKSTQDALSQKFEVISTNIDESGNITEVTTTNGYTFNKDGLNIYTSENDFNTQITNEGIYYKDGDNVVGQYTKDGSKQKDLELFGVYKYGMWNKDDSPMFIAQLYTDNDGEECFGHFFNGGDI